jgi:hypothetical protein
MLEKAAGMDDFDLIEYLSRRIAGILQEGPAADSPFPKRIIASMEGRFDHG